MVATLTAILTALGGVGGLTGVASLLFIKQERKSKDIDNEARQSEEWRKLYELEHQEVKERDTKIDQLYEEIKQHRDEKAAMAVKVAELEVRVTRAELLTCKRPGCASREPKTGY